mgnify:CR=1 FL=1
MNIKFFDGSMGTMLQAAGLKAGELPELLNLTDEEKVLAVHRAYAAAGAEYITTNTFGANRLKISNAQAVIKKGVALAKSTGKKVALDIGPTGKLLKPMGDLDFDDAVEIFAEMVNAGKDDSDVILIETMGDTYEIKAAVLAAKENSTLPVIVTMIFDESGRLLTGADIKTAVVLLEGLGVDAIGFNCGLGPKQMIAFTEEIRKWTNCPSNKTAVLGFDNYAEMVLKDDKAEKIEGIAINPFGANYILDRKVIEHIKTKKDVLTKGVAKQKVTKDTQVTLGEPKDYPTEMVEAIKAHLKENAIVKRAWLRLMYKEGEYSYLLVVDFEGDRNNVFGKIADTARPYLGDMYIDMVPFADDFGSRAVEGVEPFYQ